HVGLACRHEPALPLFVFRLHLLEEHAGQLPVLVDERLGHVEIEDRDALVHRVFLFPGRGLHLFEAGAHDYFHVLAAEAPRTAAAVHCGVAAAEHDHSLADAIDVAERNARQPVDPDVDIFRRFLAPRKVEIASPRSAATDEDRVVGAAAVAREQRLQTVYSLTGAKLDAQAEYVADLFVDHRLGQAELGDLAPDHPSGLRVRVVDDAFVAERRQVARDRQRRRPGADQCNALAARFRGALGEPVAYIVLEIRGYALQAT